MPGSSPYRLVAFDLDGTLLEGPSEIPAGRAEAIRRLRARGVLIAPATARFHPLSLQPFLKLKLDVPSVSAAGADVRGPAGEVIAQHPLPRDVAARLLELCDERRWIATVMARAGNYQRLNELPAWARQPPPFLSPVTDLRGIDRGDVLSILIATDGADDSVSGLGPLADSLTVYDAVRHDGQRLITVTAAGVDKGTGLRELCDWLGIGSEAVMVFGDSAVDVPMFAVAGRAVAMASAPAPVRAAADVVVPEGGDGLLSVLEREFGGDGSARP